MTLDEAMEDLAHSDKEFVFDVKDVQKHIPLILFTSGSTGNPKGVLIPDSAITGYGQKFLYESGMSALGPFLLSSVLYWTSGVGVVMTSIFHGFTTILSNSIYPCVHMDLIQQYKVKSCLVLSLRASVYSKEPILSRRDLSTLEHVWAAGSPLGTKARELFVNNVLKRRIGIQEIYGMSEIGTVTTWEGSHLFDPSKTNSAGFLKSGVECKVKSEEGQELGVGKVGQLWFRSYAQFTGYWGMPDLSGDLLDAEGFFNSGDIGYVDKEGFLYVVGRGKSLTLSNSMESMSKVEDYLRSHEAIVQAVIVNNKQGDFVAFVVLNANYNLSDSDIMSLFEDGIMKTYVTEILKKVYCVDTIPLTPTGKVNLKLLQEFLVEQ